MMKGVESTACMYVLLCLPSDNVQHELQREWLIKITYRNIVRICCGTALGRKDHLHLSHLTIFEVHVYVGTVCMSFFCRQV